MYLDNLLEFTKINKKEIEKLNFDKQDVRHSFFSLFYSSINYYYIGNVSYRITEFIGEGDIKFSERVLPFKNHADRLYEIPKEQELSDNYYRNLNRNIIYSVWTSFELSVNIIYRNLVTEKDEKKAIENMLSKTFRTLKNLNSDKKIAIYSEIKKLIFIPLLRKFNYLVNKKLGCYNGNLRDDRKFLEFVNKLRNCLIHSNGFYHGNDFDYTFGIVTFKFKNNEQFKEIRHYKDVYLDITIRLKNIFSNLLNCINDIEFIEYPDDGQYFH